MFENTSVRHSRFGEGRVLSLEGSHLRVRFNSTGEERVFAYPEAFSRFLATGDSSLARDVEHRLAAQKAAQDEKTAALAERLSQQEEERRAAQADSRKKRVVRSRKK